MPTTHQRRPTAAAGAIAAVLCLLGGLAACDGAGAEPTQSPTTTRSTSTGPSPSAGPNRTPDVHLEAAQTRYVAYSQAYVDALRDGASKKPPKSLLAMVDPKGPMTDWLEKSFSSAHDGGARIVSGDLRVTTGQEIEPDVWRSERVTFRACEDGREMKVERKGQPVEQQKWLLVEVEMRAPIGADYGDKKDPTTWKLFSRDQISQNEPCTLDR